MSHAVGCIARVQEDQYFVIGRGFAVRAWGPGGVRASPRILPTAMCDS